MLLAMRHFLRCAFAIAMFASAGSFGPSSLIAGEPRSAEAPGRTSVHVSTSGHAHRDSGEWCVPSAEPRPRTLFQWSSVPGPADLPDRSQPLVSDRPTFTSSPFTVGRGVPQIEFGYTYTFDDERHESVRTHSLGEPLLRYGILAEWLELRLNLNPLHQRTETFRASESTTGTDDLLIGFKLALTPQKGMLPAMALIPEATVPTGSGSFTSDEFLPRLTWAYSWDVTDRLGIAGNTVLSRSVEEALPVGIGPYGAIEGMSPKQKSYIYVAQSLSAGYRLTDRMGAFCEWYGLFPHDARATDVEHYFDTGLKYLITDDVQWDARAGWGLNDAADDFFAGTGFSIRF